jgi:hypothetical protein
VAERKYSSAIYGAPLGVAPGTHLDRPTLSTSQGGRVAVDPLVMALWEISIGHSLEEIQQLFPTLSETRIPGVEIQPSEVQAALVCLEYAGLLSHSNLHEYSTAYPDGNSSPQNIPNQNLLSARSLEVPFSPSIDDTPGLAPDDPSGLVSVIIVAFNSLEWLPDCCHSIVSQSYTPIEIILVDNGSTDEAAIWFTSQFSNRSSNRFPKSTLIRLDTPVPLSTAINTGIQAAKGKYYLILNPDTQLDPHAVTNLVKCVEQDTEAAAVAAKLKLLWTPGFLNGLGNFVGAISWGTDCGLGHLDLGQFDDWRETPSACFAGALVRATIWQIVGPLDTNLPMYYEDSEWCYRARLFGYKILAAPEAVIFHALGSRIPGTQAERLSPSRLERVEYGRLHFITRLFGPLSWLRFLTGYLVEDLVRSFLALLRGQRAIFQAYERAWKSYLTSLPGMLEDRRTIQHSRKITDRQLLAPQKGIPPVIIWHGLPLLTWEIIQTIYAPLILADHAGSRNDQEEYILDTFPGQPGFLKRLRMIYQIEGSHACLDRLGRIIQHRLRQS